MTFPGKSPSSKGEGPEETDRQTDSRQRGTLRDRAAEWTALSCGHYRGVETSRASLWV